MTESDRQFIEQVQTGSFDAVEAIADLLSVHREACPGNEDCLCLPSVIVTQLSTGNKFLVEPHGIVLKGH